MANGILVPALAGMAMLSAAPVAERSVSGEGVITAQVNGVPGRIRIDPGAPALPLLTKSLAEAAGLRSGMIRMTYSVGPQRIAGPSAVGRIDLGSGPLKRRIGWAALPYTDGIDGVIGPGGMPEPVIRFVLRQPAPGERNVTFTLAKQGGLFGGWGVSFATVDLGGTPVQVRFSPHQPRTLATASTGARLAAQFGGHLEGASAPEAIAFGIARPVRDLVLARPFQMGPFRIARLGVRVADEGSVATVPDAEAPPPDPDEVLVVGKGKRHQDKITVGADLLAACSSIVFDKPAKLIRLSCR
jgi:hypothetical protein